MQPEEVGQICKSNKVFGTKIKRFVHLLPNMWISCTVKPITSTILRFRVQLDADFEWDGRWHGGAQSFWICVEDRDSNKIHHQEQITLSKRTYRESVVLEFMVPIFTSVPEQYYIRLCADGWVGIEIVFPVPLRDIEIPTETAPYTDLLDLTPLPTTALNNPLYEQLYTKFQTFNPVRSSCSFFTADDCENSNSDVFQDSNASISCSLSYRFRRSAWSSGKTDDIEDALHMFTRSYIIF